MNLPKGIIVGGVGGVASSANAPVAYARGDVGGAAAIKPIPFQADRRNPALEHWLANGMAGGLLVSKRTDGRRDRRVLGVLGVAPSRPSVSAPS
jgi:hypothetical protein